MATPVTLAPRTAARHRLTIRAFMWVALFEAFTWAGLLVGMFFKYVTQTTEMGVYVFGRLHGAAFVAYCVLVLVVAWQQKWRVLWTTALALAASIPPFTTLVFEHFARKNGHLTVNQETPQPLWRSKHHPPV